MMHLRHIWVGQYPLEEVELQALEKLVQLDAAGRTWAQRPTPVGEPPGVPGLRRPAFGENITVCASTARAPAGPWFSANPCVFRRGVSSA